MGSYREKVIIEQYEDGHFSVFEWDKLDECGLSFDEMIECIKRKFQKPTEKEE